MWERRRKKESKQQRMVRRRQRSVQALEKRRTEKETTECGKEEGERRLGVKKRR